VYVISSNCIKCRTCSSGCPTNPDCTGYSCKNQCGIGYVCHIGAIIEAETQFVITDKCIDCGRCAEVCPMGAISTGVPTKKSLRNHPVENEVVPKIAINF
jgi:Fe-S-cluster-containing hydrogenase component 2